VKTSAFVLSCLVLVAAPVSPAFAAGSGSRYVALATDTAVSGGSTTLLSTTVTEASAGWLYVQSDGRYFPISGGAAAYVYIVVDGTKVSNDSTIDWRGSTNPQQHAFNVIGAAQIAAGTHTVALVGTAIAGATAIGAGSNLSAMTLAATTVVNNALAADTGVLTFNNDGVADGIPFFQHTTVLQNTLFASGPLITLASGRSYYASAYGDAMWGLYVDGSEPSNAVMTWSDNDMWTGAELQAPMFNQSYLTMPAATHSVSLEATSEPWIGDRVSYRVGANTRLISLTGGVTVSGVGLNSNSALYGPSYILKGVCVGTNGFNPGNCPPDGTEVVVGQQSFTIPPGHNGVVMFTAKSRVQGDPADAGGTVQFHIKIDGNPVGNDGIQQLAAPDSVSTRTISASYLAAGSNQLAPGAHTVQVVGIATGSFRNLVLLADAPVIWFD